MAAKVNKGYVSSHRGIIKILQVIFGIIVCSLLCIGNYGGCFYEGRLGAASTINAIVVVFNIVIFGQFLANFSSNFPISVLNLFDVLQNKWERISSLVALVLFVIAFALMLWYLLADTRNYHGQQIPATVFIGIQMGLCIWDYRILHGQA